MVQKHFINIKEIYIFQMVFQGYIKQFNEQFNFNKLIENKPGGYSVEFIEAGNPSNKGRLINQKVIFASAGS